MAFISQQQLDACVTLGAVLDWAGVLGDPADPATTRGAFLQATGALRLFGVVSPEDFLTVINAIRIRTPTAGEADAAPELRAPTFVERAAWTSVGYFCRRQTGLFDAPPAAVPALPLAGVPTAPAGPLPRKVKLSYVVRQGDDTEIDLMTEDLIRRGYARWETLFGVGSRPSQDAEVTDAQLTALNHLARSESNIYVDFALWGPHGLRLERKLRLTGSIFSADGTLRTIEIEGPPTIDVWVQSWTVFATACIMLEIVDLGTLLTCKDHICRFHARYGPQTWLLLYQADTRLRLEHLIRIRRKLARAHVDALVAGGTTQFDPRRPWNHSFADGMKDSEWWHLEFGESALMLFARTAHLDSFVGGDAPVQPSRTMAPHPEASKHRPPPVQHDLKRNPKKPRVDNSTTHNGKFTSNRRGAKLCGDFQTGACSRSTFMNKCPKDRDSVHQCAICLSPDHGDAHCNSQKTPGDRTFVAKDHGFKGKGKGKGKGKYR